MPGRFEDSAAQLRLFLVLLLLSLASMAVSWIRGQRWGDLSSRRHDGQVLTDEETAELRRSRRSCLIWVSASFVFAMLSFYALR